MPERNDSVALKSRLKSGGLVQGPGPAESPLPTTTSSGPPCPSPPPGKTRRVSGGVHVSCTIAASASSVPPSPSSPADVVSCGAAWSGKEGRRSAIGAGELSLLLLRSLEGAGEQWRRLQFKAKFESSLSYLSFKR